MECVVHGNLSPKNVTFDKFYPDEFKYPGGTIFNQASKHPDYVLESLNQMVLYNLCIKGCGKE